MNRPRWEQDGCRRQYWRKTGLEENSANARRVQSRCVESKAELMASSCALGKVSAANGRASSLLAHLPSSWRRNKTIRTDERSAVQAKKFASITPGNKPVRFVDSCPESSEVFTLGGR